MDETTKNNLDSLIDYYSTIADISDNLIFIMDENFIIKYCNNEFHKVISFEPNLAINKNLNEMDFWDGQVDLSELTNQFSNSEIPVTFSAILNRKSPSPSPVEFRLIKKKIHSLSFYIFSGKAGHYTPLDEPDFPLTIFKSLIEGTDTAFVIMDTKGTVIEANDIFLQFTGRKDMESIVGKNVKEWTAPYDIQRTERELELCTQKGYSKNLRLDYQHDDGNIVSLEIFAKLVSTGSKQQIFGICWDISHLRLVEREVDDIADKYKTLVEYAKDAIFMIHRGIILECNGTAEDMFGTTRNNIIGKTPDKLSPKYQPNGKPSKEILFEKAMLSLKGYSQVFEWRHIKADGTEFDTEVSMKKMSLQDEPYFLAVIRDISERKKAEAFVKNTAKRFRLIVDQAPYAIQVHDTEGALILVNPAWNELWGINDMRITEEILKYYHFIKDPQMGILGFHEAFYDALNGKVTDIAEYYFDPVKSAIQGRQRWLHSRVFPIKDENNKIESIAIIHEDITEKKKTKDDLKKSEEYFRNLIDNATDVITILDIEANVKYESPSHTKVLGYPDGYLLGSNGFDNIHPDDRQILAETFKEFVTKPGDTLKLSFRFKHYEGHWVYLEGTAKNMLHEPIIDGIVINYRDVSDRVKAEQDLKRSEELLRTAFDNISDGLLLVEENGSITQANEQFYLIWNISKNTNTKSDETLLNYVESQVIDPENFRKRVNEIYHSNERSYDEIYLKENKVLERLSVPVYFGNSKARLWNFRDISRRKKTELEIRRLNKELESRVEERTAELQSSNKELQHFAYVVSHDLKAPLRGISQLAYWIIEDYSDLFDDEGRETLELLINRVQRLNALIDGILEYSRVGRIEGQKEDIDINVLIEDITDLVAAPENIKIFCSNDLPVINANKARIEQVFQNLIENAIKYNDKTQGIIEISSSENDTHWIFAIKDNGPGIEEKYHDKIFGIFQTLGLDNNNQSTGIGLSVVKKIIKMYQGKIWIESEPGKSTTFNFTWHK